MSAATQSTQSVEVPEKPDQDAQLRSMIESTGLLDIDESGNLDFHGGSSGAVFMNMFRDLLSNDQGVPFFPSLPMPKTLVSLHDSPRSSIESPIDAGIPNTMELPSREMAKILCDNSLDCACALLRFIHRPTFSKMFDRIYDLPPENFGDAENRFLPLLYMVLAVGCMFDNAPSDIDNQGGGTQLRFQISISEG